MPLLREGNIIAGKYRLERLLARGGMGSLWVARHVHLNMRVAIKFMATSAMDSEEARTRFDREAKVAAQIQSPHVAQVHDYGVQDGVPYIAMELLQGEDLGRRLRRERRLSLTDVARILAQASKALRKAHEAGLIHRDLKPANIFLARNDDDDDEEIVKILDFGVVKVATLGVVTEATRTGIVVGSVNYMSPEQARGAKDLDLRSDLWSLGVLAFRALVGQHPFPGEQVGDVIVKICSEPIPNPSDLAPDLGPEVDAFFKRALARNLTERFQNAREFAMSLSAVAGIAPANGGTGAWPLALAARSPLPSVVGLAPTKPTVILEGDGRPASSPAMPGERRSSLPQIASSGGRCSDMPTELDASSAVPAPPSSEPAPPPRSAPSGSQPDIASPVSQPSSQWLLGGGTLTDAPRVSDVTLLPVPRPWNGTRLLAAAGVGLTLLIGGWLLFRGDATKPPELASPPPSLPTSPADAPKVAEVAPTSRAPTADPPPVTPVTPPSSDSAKAPATSSKPNRGPTSPPSSARPSRGPPTKKINPTLGI